LRILIVDDSLDQRQLLEALLKTGGYTDLLLAESPMAAVQHPAVGRPTEAHPPVDLILMDIEMPELDGIDACRQLKRFPHLKDIPIVMVTGVTESDALPKAFAAGAVDYIAKPVNKLELLARVRSVLALKQETDQRKARERDLQRRTEELEAALQEIKTLRGCLPICTGCKKVRDDKGFWNQIEVYVEAHSEAEFSSSLCPQCVMKMAGKAGVAEPRRRGRPKGLSRLGLWYRNNYKWFLVIVGLALTGFLATILLQFLWVGAGSYKLKGYQPHDEERQIELLEQLKKERDERQRRPSQ
jgi:CheY-like chemotaxis protein